MSLEDEIKKVNERYEAQQAANKKSAEARTAQAKRQQEAKAHLQAYGPTFFHELLVSLAKQTTELSSKVMDPHLKLGATNGPSGSLQVMVAVAPIMRNVVKTPCVLIGLSPDGIHLLKQTMLHAKGQAAVEEIHFIVHEGKIQPLKQGTSISVEALADDIVQAFFKFLAG